ncbi:MULTISPECIES: TonB-dependent receptor [Zunongwangia]|jgi:iron complex outermembrane receptor protein|uniref:TonB-dependent receptor n=1 Tax=Zunongwangia TaxID=417127 RepID=UPI001D184C02|nr:TonB-dependent receptor [Zunongwangia profunda]MCC4228493.1 TonB-dependent receptor [Zunongwangia profunda]
MKKSLLLLFLILSRFYGASAQNQSAELSGFVFDEQQNLVSNAHIYLKDSNYGAYTNQNGFFSIANIPKGEYTLVISEIGFIRKELTVNIQSNKTIEVIIQKEITSLSDVWISGEKEAYTTRKVSSSLRLDEEIINIPQNIQIITNDVLKDQAAISIMENVTRNVSGAQMIEHWGNFARINMRGFRIPPFRNGMNVLSTWGPMAEDLALVDRIEVVKGPSAFMLSSGEPGGLYNVVTKKPTGKTGGEISILTGSYNTLRATADIEGNLSENKKLQYRFVGAASTKEAHRDFEPENRYTLAPSIKYNFNDKTSVTAQYTYQYYKTKLIGSAYVFAPNEYADVDRDFTLSDPRLGPSVMKEHYGFINFKHQLNQNWNLTAQLSYLNYQHEGSSLWINSAFGVQENGDLLRNISIWDAKEEQKLGQVFINGKELTGDISHKILGGLDYGNKNYIADWSQSLSIDTQDNPFNIYNPQPAALLPEFDRSKNLQQRASGIITSNYLSYYLQDQLGFFDDALRLTLAGRYTEFKSSAYGVTSDDKVFTPRVAVSYSILDNLVIYGMYDQSFLPEQGTNRFGDAFDPVTAEDIEGGLKFEFLNGKWNATATYFDIHKDKFLVADPEDANYSLQVDTDITSRGFEFDTRGEITKGLNLILNYAYTNVEDADGNPIAGFSKHITNGWLDYTFQNQNLKGFGISLGYQYQVDRSSWVWGADGQTDLPDYFRMDGALSWENDNFRVALNLNNLLNEYLYSGADYGTYVYWQSEPGRNFRLSLNYKF